MGLLSVALSVAVALPLPSTAAEPSELYPSENCTVPAGCVELSLAELTVAVNVTDSVS